MCGSSFPISLYSLHRYISACCFRSPSPIPTPGKLAVSLTV
jgi:hypothetical protein